MTALAPSIGALEPIASVDDLAAAWLLGYGNERTRNGYAAELREYRAFLLALDVDPLEAHRAHVEAFARSLELHGRSKATVARKLAALASFYSYAVDEDVIERSPVARVRRPKVSGDSQRLGLDRDEMRAFLKAARASGRRDSALALLLALNGLRISEALAVDVADLSRERGHRTVEIARKGGRRARAPLAVVTGEAIDAYLEGRTAGPLFIVRSGRRMIRQEAAKVIVRLAREAGIEKRISPHSLRHSFVTQALDAGTELRDVQDAAGHADPKTTIAYDRDRGRLDRHPTYAVAAAVA